jgi:G3E family GTPase
MALGTDILRCKGLLWINGFPAKMVLQGVQMTGEVGPGEAWQPGEARGSTLVFIGRRLPRERIEAELDAALA